MPEVCRFFGIVIRMYFSDHSPPHMHVVHQGNKAVVDFDGNVIRGTIGSRTGLYLLRQWIELHRVELEEDWQLARSGQAIKKIAPLD